ncbi:hypothetical protein EDD18DRAFT_1331940 [Armillaria luteobubalina]|uniref:Uncharacterized protein n=1 Tax=Armillaria luteobubalina TaxID=153913 RepID=A0AA39UP65_9AGAR|nr:hypothetical protein EDD18DRAFT_1331940 [Armillaria luteobubalina]
MFEYGRSQACSAGKPILGKVVTVTVTAQPTALLSYKIPVDLLVVSVTRFNRVALLVGTPVPLRGHFEGPVALDNYFSGVHVEELANTCIRTKDIKRIERRGLLGPGRWLGGKGAYPDEVSESGDESLDTSWEDSNEYDFEYLEYLKLSPSFNDTMTDNGEASEEEVIKRRLPIRIRCAEKSTAPSARPSVDSTCMSSEACPVCDERATEDQLRKIYLSQK